jgi:hypothetical protein
MNDDKPPPVWTNKKSILVTLIIGMIGWAGFFLFVALLAWIAKHVI